MAVQQRFLLRRAAEGALQRSAAARGRDLVATYRKTMDRAYGLPGTAQDEARETLDQEATLGAADYLRGWLLGAQLRAALVRKFGAAWWTDPGAGAFLKPLLAPGNRMDPNGLARALGDPGITPEAFVAAVVPQLSGAKPASPVVPATPAPRAGEGSPPGVASAAPDAGLSSGRPDAGASGPEAAGTK